MYSLYYNLTTKIRYHFAHFASIVLVKISRRAGNPFNGAVVLLHFQILVTRLLFHHATCCTCQHATQNNKSVYVKDILYLKSNV